MKPVAHTAIYWFADIISAGLDISPIFAMVINHLKLGAQKNTIVNLERLRFTCEGTSGVKQEVPDSTGPWESHDSGLNYRHNS